MNEIWSFNPPPQENLFTKAVNWHNSSFRKEGDKYIFTDPENGEPLSTERPPAVLKKDENLETGYKFLEEFGHLVNCEAIYARHLEAADFGDEGFGYEQRVASSDIYLMEGLGWDESLANELNQVATTQKVGEEILNYVVDSELRLRQVEAIALSEAKVGFFDIENSPGNELREVLIKGANLIHAIRESESLEKDKETTEIINTVAFEIVREWFMVGQLGYQVAKICQNDQVLLSKLSAGDLKVLITVGKTHTDLTRKLKQFGVQVEESISSLVDLNEADKLVAEAITKCALTEKDLATLLDK